MAFFLFRLIFFVLFVGIHCAMIAGLIREWLWDRKARSEGGDLPLVSVIVPFRNESRRMEGLLRSLALQDYPACEFILVDDLSKDESPKLLAAFAESRKNCRVLSLAENPGPNFKQYALGRGIEAAAGEFLLFTDADCEVPPGWIRAMTARMGDERVGAVIGPVFKKSGGRGFFHFYQCIDHGIRYLYLAGSTGLGAAGGGFGNNLILRRKSLELIGGYDAVPPSPTEDAALVSRIRAVSKYRLHSAIGKDTHVFTGAEAGWGSFLNQTLRWNNGGLFSPDPLTRLNFGYLMLAISAGIITAPLLVFFPALWPLPLAVLTAMIMNTAAVIFLWKDSLPGNWLFYAVQLFFTPFWMTVLTILGFLRVKVSWKGNQVK